MLRKIKNYLDKTAKKRYHSVFSVDNPGPRTVGRGPLDALQAEKIVNEYGRAMIIGNQLNRIPMKNLFNDTEADSGPVGKQDADPCNNEYDLLLPHPPDIIKEALELLLEHERDVYNIETLKLGLKYLEYFR